MELPRRVGGVAGHDEEVCDGGGQREGERERGTEVEYTREEVEEVERSAAVELQVVEEDGEEGR